jgi:hypothetical protein
VTAARTDLHSLLYTTDSLKTTQHEVSQTLESLSTQVREKAAILDQEHEAAVRLETQFYQAQLTKGNVEIKEAVIGLYQRSMGVLHEH